MALAIKLPQDRKRVKVYELRDNDWFDRGTGFCTGAIVEVSLSDAIAVAHRHPPSRCSRDRLPQFSSPCCVPGATWSLLFWCSFYYRRLILLSYDGRAGFEEMPRLIHRLVLGHAPDIRRVRR
jgi:hypothetical protein